MNGHVEVSAFLRKSPLDLRRKLLSAHPGHPSGTKNKLYIACSRARGDLIFVPERLLKPYKTVA